MRNSYYARFNVMFATSISFIILGAVLFQNSYKHVVVNGEPTMMANIIKEHYLRGTNRGGAISQKIRLLNTEEEGMFQSNDDVNDEISVTITTTQQQEGNSLSSSTSNTAQSHSNDNDSTIKVREDVPFNILLMLVTFSGFALGCISWMILNYFMKKSGVTKFKNKIRKHCNDNQDEQSTTNDTITNHIEEIHIVHRISESNTEGNETDDTNTVVSDLSGYIPSTLSTPIDLCHMTKYCIDTTTLTATDV